MNTSLQKIYSEIPRSYELINHILTFGMDKICRKKATLIAVEGGGNRWLDICCGTGEMAANLWSLKGSDTEMCCADFSLPMVRIARKKFEPGDMPFIIAEAGQLPFYDNHFDLITISFATRNLNSSRDTLIKRFSEFRRILKPGGRFINLETSQPKSNLIRRLMHLYVKMTVKQIGTYISGNKAGYAYLASSIPRFYRADELTEILYESGFSSVDLKSLFAGIIAVHKAVK